MQALLNFLLSKRRLANVSSSDDLRKRWILSIDPLKRPDFVLFRNKSLSFDPFR